MRICVSLLRVIDTLVEEKGLERSVLSNIVCEGMLSAYQKRYPYLTLRVTYDEKLAQPTVEVEKMVVANVEDDEIEISVRKAKNFNKKADVGNSIWVPFEGTIGRIEILKAKQFIATRIRDIEAAVVYKEFKDKEGTIVQGIVHKCERNGVVVKLQDHLAFLPKSLSIADEKFIPNFPVRVLLKEVLLQPRNENQLILDRASSDFVAKLFELEIPEVYEKLVDIRKIVRVAGYKTKIVVSSNDQNIDPVGTCVGVGGVRIKPILKELGNEKIDIIALSDSLESFVRDSLKPAEINRVEISDDGKKAKIWLDDDQRSLAIGRLGQNIALASQLTGLEVELVNTNKPADFDAALDQGL